MANKRNAVLVPLIAILGGFVLGAFVVLGTGRDPLVMFSAMFQASTGINPATGGYNPRLVGEFLVQVMPIMLTGLSVAFAFRSGLFNIGAEGQLIAGSTASIGVALFVHAPPGLHQLLILLAGMAAGGLWGALPGWLKARFNVHEVVVTIMMNYVAFYLNNWMVLKVYGTIDGIKTVKFPESAVLRDSFLSSITNGSQFHWGFVPVLLAVAVSWFLVEKTTFGFGLRAVGFNKEGARYAGMKVEASIVWSMAIAGAFAGLAGSIITIGTFSFGRVLPGMEGYGMDGIAVALVGANTAVGVFLAAILFGALKAAQTIMQVNSIPKEIASIIQASIVLFIAMKLGIDYLLARLSRKAEPADGEGSKP
jgi:simple sugar transport system permease protein